MLQHLRIVITCASVMKTTPYFQSHAVTVVKRNIDKLTTDPKFIGNAVDF